MSESHVFPGGFCTRTCDEPGRSAGCPSGSVCAITAERRLCAPTCEPADDPTSACGEGLSCAPSDDAEGPAACVLRP